VDIEAVACVHNLQYSSVQSARSSANPLVWQYDRWLSRIVI